MRVAMVLRLFKIRQHQIGQIASQPKMPMPRPIFVRLFARVRELSALIKSIILRRAFVWGFTLENTEIGAHLAK